MPKGKEELVEARAERYRPPTPPYNGFGSYQDSLHNVRYLNPHGKVRVYKVDSSKEP